MKEPIRPKWTPCGGNADWVDPAWHYGTRTPNMYDKGIYLIDAREEHENFAVVMSYPETVEPGTDGYTETIATFDTYEEGVAYVEKNFWFLVDAVHLDSPSQLATRAFEAIIADESQTAFAYTVAMNLANEGHMSEEEADALDFDRTEGAREQYSERMQTIMRRMDTKQLSDDIYNGANIEF